MAQAFAEMQAKGTQALLLDLRDNGGGRDEMGKLLLSYLLEQPFSYYQDLIVNTRALSVARYCDPAEPVPADLVEMGRDGKWHCPKHPNWGVQQPGKPTFTGKVIVLINGGSFSTTCEFLSNLHARHRATFVGEEAGGGYYGNTSGFGTVVTLPHSKLTLELPMMTYYLAVTGFKHPAHGVPPDVRARITIKDLLAHHDAPMAAALSLVQAQ